MRILVVEDQNAIRRMIEALVAARGHQVVAVINGTQALEQAASGRFDLLLLDLNLPGQFDGFAVCQRLKASPATKDLTIIVISALDDAVSRARALGAGATSYFTKPFSPMTLLREIDRIAASRPPTPSPASPPPAAGA